MVVEDNPEYRGVIELALEDESDIELVSQFGTAEIALRSLKNSAREELPELILLDLNLPGASGLDALPYFLSLAPDAKVLILTQSDDDRDVLRAISQGVDGYLLKSADLDQITSGIRNVMAGGGALDPNVARVVMENLQHRLSQIESDVTLTKREVEILKLLADVLVKKEIAEHLKIGYSTVDTHVGHIYEKLEVKNAPSAVSRAYQMGLFIRGD